MINAKSALEVHVQMENPEDMKYLEAALKSLAGSTKFRDLLAAALGREGIKTYEVAVQPPRTTSGGVQRKG